MDSAPPASDLPGRLFKNGCSGPTPELLNQNPRSTAQESAFNRLPGDAHDQWNLGTADEVLSTQICESSRPVIQSPLTFANSSNLSQPHFLIWKVRLTAAGFGDWCAVQEICQPWRSVHILAVLCEFNFLHLEDVIKVISLTLKPSWQRLRCLDGV